MGNASSNSDSDDYHSDAGSEDGEAGGGGVGGGVHGADSDFQNDENLISNLALLFKHGALRELAAKIRVDVPGE